LQLITCADEVLLVGTGPTGVNLLKSYPASSFRTSPATTESHPAEASMFQSGLAEDDSPAPTIEPLETDPDRLTAEEEPEWTVASAAAIGDGPDFLTVLRRYAGRKTYKANTLYPPKVADPNG
jgi:hypothetical protein